MFGDGCKKVPDQNQGVHVLRWMQERSNFFPGITCSDLDAKNFGGQNETREREREGEGGGGVSGTRRRASCVCVCVGGGGAQISLVPRRPSGANLRRQRGLTPLTSTLLLNAPAPSSISFLDFSHRFFLCSLPSSTRPLLLKKSSARISLRSFTFIFFLFLCLFFFYLAFFFFFFFFFSFFFSICGVWVMLLHCREIALVSRTLWADGFMIDASPGSCFSA